MATALGKMFATLPLPAANASPNEALRVYYEVCQPYSTEDVELAVKQFLSGTVKDFNPNFAPSAPRFAKQMHDNAEYRSSTVASRNLLLEQFREQELDEEWAAKRTPEAKARVQSMLEAAREAANPQRKPEDLAKAKAELEKHDQFFAGNFVEASNGQHLSSYLVNQLHDKGLTTFNVVDDDQYDMGQMGGEQAA